MPLDRTILNLGGISFVLFDVSLQNKILHYKRTVTPRSAASDQGLHCLPKSPVKRCLWTDPLDKIIRKLRGSKFVLFTCKFTKVPVLWQTVLTLNRQTVLRLSDQDLHC